MSSNYLDIIRPGINTTFQDKGRDYLYHIGVPFSGAMDSRNYLIANKKEILWRAEALSIPTVLLTPRTVQFLGNNDVVTEEIMTDAQLKAFDTSENHYSRSLWRSEVSDEGNSQSNESSQKVVASKRTTKTFASVTDATSIFAIPYVPTMFLYYFTLNF